MTYLFAFLAACLFAIELAANLKNGVGLISWMHLIVIGGLEVMLVGYLLHGLWARLRGRRPHIPARNRG